MVEIIMKKILFFVCLTIFNLSLLMAEDCRVCYGQFITIEKYNDLLKHKETFKSKNNAEELPSVYHNVYNLTFINILDFFVLYKDHNGQIQCNINVGLPLRKFYSFRINSKICKKQLIYGKKCVVINVFLIVQSSGEKEIYVIFSRN